MILIGRERAQRAQSGVSPQIQSDHGFLGRRRLCRILIYPTIPGLDAVPAGRQEVSPSQLLNVMSVDRHNTYTNSRVDKKQQFARGLLGSQIEGVICASATPGTQVGGNGTEDLMVKGKFPRVQQRPKQVLQRFLFRASLRQSFLAPRAFPAIGKPAQGRQVKFIYPLADGRRLNQQTTHDAFAQFVVDRRAVDEMERLGQSAAKLRRALATRLAPASAKDIQGVRRRLRVEELNRARPGGVAGELTGNFGHLRNRVRQHLSAQ